jgi:hypothetical protein
MTNTPQVLCVDCCVTFKFLRQSLLNAALINSILHELLIVK